MMYPSVEENIAINNSPSRGNVSRNKAIIGATLFAFSLLFAVFILNSGITSFFLIIVGLVGLPAIYTIIAYPKTGILLLIVSAYIIMFLGRFNLSFPMGTVMDVIEFLLIISFFLKQKYEQNWNFAKNKITAVVVMWICYNLLEALNPSADSRLAWLYAVRPIALVAMTYFLFQFYIRDIKFIRTIFKLWIGLSVIVAVYALKQEYFGFADFEMKWIKADPIITNLYFIGNHWRKFSIFSDPVSFAYNMVISSILCVCLMTGPLSSRKKIVLGLLSCLFFIAMLYSGTRGAYVLYPITFAFYSVLKYNKRVMLMGAVLVVVAVVLIFMPTSNYTLYRFQTAFKPNKDASYLLRKANQKRIQPFIQSHPLGGGIGSTGVWGKRFSPYSELASFPPDSGYVRVAVEMGWLGLLIFCTFIFVVLRTGVNNFFLISDPELKSYCLAMVMILFALNMGNYPQEALVQYPINIYFYMCIALLNLTLKLDKETNVIQPKRRSNITGGKTYGAVQ
jgi:putative inorganic carbon (hco3(-)) transporter